MFVKPLCLHHSCKREILEECFKGRSVEELVNFFTRLYKEDRKTIRKNVYKFLQALHKRKLIATANGVLAKPNLRWANTKPPLETVFLEITRSCNLKCIHCYLNAGPPFPEELTTDELYELIDVAVELGVLKPAITGGEPLLRPDIFDVMRYATENSLMVDLFTNCTLIKAKEAKRLKKIGISNVLTSLDGATSETHDTFRGVQGSFKKTISAIKLLKNNGIHVTANITLTKKNVHEINRLIRLLNDILRVRYQISDIIEAGRGENSVQLNLSTNTYVQVWRELIQKNIDFERLSRFLMPTECSTDRVTFFGETSCGIGESMCFVTADGKVCLCPTLTHRENTQFLAGDLRKKSLKDIWERSNTFRKFRYINCNLLKSKECKYAKICQGGCRSRAYLRFGDIEEPDHVLCELMEACDDLFKQYFSSGTTNEDKGEM